MESLYRFGRNPSMIAINTIITSDSDLNFSLI